MQQNKKVSVIVPVYNSESHLCTCLNSIINQSLKDIEIICVDDGSTDSSWEILQRYQALDQRIILFHQPNQYAGVARNTGKSHATGDYLVFWDSDDYFYPHALETMYEQCIKDQADVCVCDANQFLEDRQVEVPANGYVNMKRIPEQRPFNRSTNPDYILNFTTAEPWNKMFRRSYIENMQLDFQPIRNGNDIYFVINALCLAERITIVPEPLVCYRRNQSNSLLSTLSSSPLNPIRAWIDVAENLKSLNAFPEHSFVNKVTRSIFFILHNINDWEAFQTTINFLKKEGLSKLSIKPDRDPNYYYTKWHYPCLEHLFSDSPEHFLVYFCHLTYLQQMNATAQKRSQHIQYKKKLSIQINKLSAQTKRISIQKEKLRAEKEKYAKLRKKYTKSQQQLLEIKNSWTFRIGKIILWLPSKIKHAFSR